MAVPQFVHEIVGVKNAARIGETSSVVVDGGLLVYNLAFAFLRIDHVCCLSWLGTWWTSVGCSGSRSGLLSVCTAPQIVEEIWKVLQAALLSRTALLDGLQVSTVQCINALCGSASGLAAMRLLFQSSRFTRRHCGHSEVIAEVWPRTLINTMILPRSWKVCRPPWCEDLGMCFELYGILASDEHREDRFSVMTTFFESLDAEVERINVG